MRMLLTALLGLGLCLAGRAQDLFPAAALLQKEPDAKRDEEKAKKEKLPARAAGGEELPLPKEDKVMPKEEK